jgi:ABC-type antimicrobial peptide transport system permease subunit
LAQVVRQGLALAVVGLALGLGTAFLSAHLLDKMLFGVSPRDPFIYGSVAGGLLLVALLANLAPARRAAAVDPMSALRVE